MSTNYKDKMLDNIVLAIESTGSDDHNYTEKQRSIDSLEILEQMLAYGIAMACKDRETIREACEDIAFSMKKLALAFEENNSSKNPLIKPNKTISPNQLANDRQNLSNRPSIHNNNSKK